MKRMFPLVTLALTTTAHADPNAPLLFQMRPEQYHAYQNDPPPPLTLTLTLSNPTTRPVALTCRAVGGPVLRRFTGYQNYKDVNRDEALGELKPQGKAPVCGKVGEVLTLPARTTFTYTRALGPQKVGAQVHYRAGWNVSAAPGSGWLRSTSTFALVVSQDRPIPTPNPRAYQEALNASRARWYSRTSIYAPSDQRLSFELADELSRQAFLAELKKRGLDPGWIDIKVAPPAQFPSKPKFAHRADVTVTQTAQGYVFTLKVTNKSPGPVEGGAWSVCENLAIERASDGLRIWETGNGPCADVGMPRVILQPGQSNSREAQWDGKNSLGQPAAPGRYRVRMGLGQFVGEAIFEVK